MGRVMLHMTWLPVTLLWEVCNILLVVLRFVDSFQGQLNIVHRCVFIVSEGYHYYFIASIGSVTYTSVLLKHVYKIAVECACLAIAPERNFVFLKCAETD